MRKVVFYIDDIKYFRNFLKKMTPPINENDTNEMMNGLNSFVAIYTLYSDDKDEKVADRFELVDGNGEKISINSLNCYQKGVIINDCMAYFSGSSYFDGASEPCGVIRIEESVI